MPPGVLERKPSREEQAVSEDESAAPHQPRPAPARPQYQTFGPDPSTFDDPTIYHIQEVNSSTSEEEKKAILGVKHYPPNSLYELTCGKPPDRNLENAKPAQQTAAATFAQFLEPFFREYKEEDLSFLNNRVCASEPRQVAGGLEANTCTGRSSRAHGTATSRHSWVQGGVG